MKKNAFTLIELLAVIVILAIIAVIATPIILGIINDARLKGKESSVYGLMDSVKMVYTKSQLSAEPLSLPLTATINSNGIIVVVDRLGKTVEAEYVGEKPLSGTIEMDTSGDLSAVRIKYADGYTCNVGHDKHGCTKNIFTSTDSNFVSDPNDLERMIFQGANPRNYVMLKEIVNNEEVEVEYRIISVERDGSIKVIRNELLTNESGTVINKAFDSKGARPVETSSYCISSAASGCNAWSKMDGKINDFADKFTSKDAELNIYLNTTFYNTLSESTKLNIINHLFNLVNTRFSNSSGKGISITELYNHGKRANTWVGKIGLLELRDWFNAASECVPETDGGYYNDTKTNQTSVYHETNYVCSKDNYL